MKIGEHENGEINLLEAGALRFRQGDCLHGPELWGGGAASFRRDGQRAETVVSRSFGRALEKDLLAEMDM